MYHLFVETDWDFSIKYKDHIYAYYAFTLSFESSEELNNLVFMGAYGTDGEGKSQYVKECIEKIKENPEQSYNSLGGNTGCCWYKSDTIPTPTQKEKTFTLSQIKEFCEDYDQKWGKYPKSPYEGQFVFEFIEEKINEV